MRVPIGTPIDDVLAFCNIPKEKLQMVIAGGIMMGNCVIDTTRPVTKTANALLCFQKPYDRDHSPCIRCGKCVEACPIRLAPLMIEKAYARRDIDELRRQNVELCINCGCCSYVCPAKRDLSHKNQIAKGYLKAEDAAKKALNIQS
ncbi:MAG: 4Fe-4S dicluster domain-containing protein [Clostridia bacterium]|nr:4Fe-4S dicluster domain-containing protein [Clostridia bacterium]